MDRFQEDLQKSAAGILPGGNPLAHIREHTAPSKSESAPSLTDISTLPSVWDMEVTLDWLVEGVVPRASVTLITAESGTGKTWLAYYLAGCVAHGRNFLDRGTQAVPVLYVDGENPLYVAKRNLFELGIERTDHLKVWGTWHSEPPGPEDPRIIEYAKHYKPLIIYDSLIEFHDGNEQSASETRAFMRGFRRLAASGATIVILHHTGKTETSRSYRGSSDIKAAVDMCYRLEALSEQSGRLGRLALKCFKGRLAPGQNLAMEFRPGQGFVSCEQPNRAAVRSTEEIIKEILLARPNSNQKQLVALGREQGLSKHQVEECLRNGPWRRRPGRGSEILYAVDDEFEEELI